MTSGDRGSRRHRCNMTDSSPMYAHVRGPANTRASEYQDQEEAADVTNAVLDAPAPRISPRDASARERSRTSHPGCPARWDGFRTVPRRSRRRGSAAPWLEPAQGAHVQLHDARPLRPVGQGRPHVQPSGGFSSRRIRVGAVAHPAGEVSSSASGASSTSGTTRSRPAHPPELPSAAPWTWTRPSATGLRDRCGRRGSGARRGLHRLFRSALTAGGRRRLGPRPSAASGGSSGRGGES